MVANRPSAFLRVFSVPFFMHFVRGFAAWAFLVFWQNTRKSTTARGANRSPRLGTQGTVLCVLTKHPNKQNTGDGTVCSDKRPK